MRFGDLEWRRLVRVAEQEGISTAELIRQGMAAYVAVLAERERADDLEAAIAELRHEVAALKRSRRL